MESDGPMFSKALFSRVSTIVGNLEVVLPIIIVGFITSVGLEIITPVINLDLDSHHFSSTYIGLANVMWPTGFFLSTLIFPSLVHFFSARGALLSSLALIATLVLFFWRSLMTSYLFPMDLSIGFLYGILFLSLRIFLLGGGVKNKATIIAIFGTVIAFARTIGSSIVGFVDINSITPFLISSLCLWIAFFITLLVKLTQDEAVTNVPKRAKKKISNMSILRATPYLILLSFALGLCKSPLNIFLPLYGKHLGLDTGSAAWLISIYLGGAMILSFPIAILGDKFGHRRILIYCTAVLMLISGLNYYLSDNLFTIKVSLFFMGGIISSIYSLALAFISGDHDGRILAGIIAAFSMSGKFGGILSSVTTGEVIAHFGHNILFIILAIGASIMLVSVLLHRRSIRIQE